MKDHTKNIIITILFMALSFGAGVMLGTVNGVNWAVSIGLSVFERAGFDLGDAADMLGWGIYAYKNQINQCYSDEVLQNSSVESVV